MGIGGIIVNETTLNEAIKMCGESPITVKNFQLIYQTEDGGKLYAAEQQNDIFYLILQILNHTILMAIITETNWL